MVATSAVVSTAAMAVTGDCGGKCDIHVTVSEMGDSQDDSLSGRKSNVGSSGNEQWHQRWWQQQFYGFCINGGSRDGNMGNNTHRKAGAMHRSDGPQNQ